MKIKLKFFIIFVLLNSFLYANNNEKKIYNEANHFYKNQEFDKALENYSKIFDTKNKKLKFKAYYNAGNSAFRMQDFEKAKEFYKKAIDLNSKDYDSRFNLELVQNLKQQKQENKQQKQEEEKKQKQKEKKEEQQKQEQKEQQKQNEEEQQKQKQKQNYDYDKKLDLSKKEAERLLATIADEKKRPKEKAENKWQAVKTGQNW